jgi:ferrous iron transport protein B
MSVTSPPRPLNVALVGNPNTGKSTLFSALTGVHARIGNFPGVTVEKKTGWLTSGERQLQLIDLPGTYSLSPRSLDERVSVDVLLGQQPEVGAIDAVLCVVDATNLERHLYVVSQVLDLGRPTVIALNFWDLAVARGIQIDVQALSQRLGLPVVICEAHRRRGVTEVAEALCRVVEQPPPAIPPVFPPAFYEEVAALQRVAEAEGQSAWPGFLTERLLLDAGGQIETQWQKQLPSTGETQLRAARERLKSQGIRIPAIEAKVRFGWARQVLEGVLVQPDMAGQAVTPTDRIDRVLTNRWFGPLLFAAVMFCVFQSIYVGAEPLMAGLETVQNRLSDQVATVLPPGPLRSLINDGFIAGVGGVLAFVPQIAFLFFFIALLEDCGYMARAAFLMDKLMTKVGLSGKSFVPLMSSFACAIPGIMATRVIENTRDRMVTILVAPLMSCSARLPVYVLLIGAFIPSTYWGGWLPLQGATLFAMTFVGLFVAIPVAWLLKSTLFRGETPPFVMELPPYKWPTFRIVFDRVLDRVWSFIARAGSLIFATNVLVWALAYLPGDHRPADRLLAQIEQAPEGTDTTAWEAEYAQSKQELLRRSVLGRAGEWIEPVIQPLGWDWRIGVGVLASFPAREVIISTLGTIYSLGGDVDEESVGLQQALQQAEWPDGRPVYTVPVALSIMVFFALCAQCASTLMVIRRETNAWKWAGFTFVYMTALAYLGAWLTYQLGTWLIAG